MESSRKSLFHRISNRIVRFSSVLLIISLILSAFILSGCGSANNALDSNSKGYASFDTSNNVYPDDYYYDEGNGISPEMPEPEKGQEQLPTESSEIPDTEAKRKIIRNASLELETKTFDQSVATITGTVELFGGYVESSYISGQSLKATGVQRNANFTVRVPSESLDSFIESVGGNFNTLSKQIYSSDITMTYYDAEARLSSLETQEERLLAMLENATELEYMIQLEQELANVRYQIENYYSTLRLYDNQVSYSTVKLNISEVIEYQPVIEKPKTFGERFATAAKDSLANFVDGLEVFAIGFIYLLPGLIVLALIAIIIVIIVKICISRSRKKQQKKAELYHSQYGQYPNPYPYQVPLQNTAPQPQDTANTNRPDEKQPPEKK